MIKTINERWTAPVEGIPVRRYFLDRNGVPTKRMGNTFGKGHYEIAQEIVDTDKGDFYGQMAKLGYARVIETETQIHVESQRLSKLQRDYLLIRGKETGCEVILNSREFIETKDPRASRQAALIVKRLLD